MAQFYWQSGWKHTDWTALFANVRCHSVAVRAKNVASSANAKRRLRDEPDILNIDALHRQRRGGGVVTHINIPTGLKI